MMLEDFRVADDMTATASKAARTVLSALQLAEIGGPKEYGEALLFCIPDGGSEFQQRVVVVGNGFQKAIPTELVRVYLDWDNPALKTPMLNALLMALRPLIESRGDLVLEQGAEGFKISLRDDG
jgi:hypothetical protein